jgi:glycosyltransferase involved in cell wall biosynthesis
MRYALLAFIGIIVLFIILGDVKPRHSITISPEKAAAIRYKHWPMWRELDPTENRIRMLWIIHDYVPFVNAGSEICAHTINRFCMTKPYKYDIYVACPGMPQRVYENIRCFDLYDTNAFQTVLSDAHILHSHSYYYRNQLLWLSRITGKPFVEWVHTDNYVRSIKNEWNDTRLEGRQWTVFNSESLRSTRPELPDTYTKIIKPIVNYREYGIEEEKRKPVYVTLSNVNENKGGYLLLQLAEALPEIEFLGIMGGYRKQIVSETLPNLKYIRHTTEIKDVYAQTWVLIMPSKEETWGRTAVEAMSSGIPVIVSPTPGLKECCADAAIYCDRTDLEAWVTTLRRLKMDKEYYNYRSRLSAERARALDPDPGLSQMEEWLEKTVKRSEQLENVRLPTLLEKNLLFR